MREDHTLNARLLVLQDPHSLPCAQVLEVGSHRFSHQLIFCIATHVGIDLSPSRNSSVFWILVHFRRSGQQSIKSLGLEDGFI